MESLIPRSVIIALTEMNVHNMNLTWKIQSLQDEKAIKLELTWTARENQAKDRVNRQMKKDSATKGQVRVSEQNGYGDILAKKRKILTRKSHKFSSRNLTSLYLNENLQSQKKTDIFLMA